jgi:hypothetical protein
MSTTVPLAGVVMTIHRRVKGKVITLDQLNIFHAAISYLGESHMNVTWDGAPADADVKQIADDAAKVWDLWNKLRDDIAESIGAAWDDEQEKYTPRLAS